MGHISLIQFNVYISVADYDKKRRICSLPEQGYNPRLSEEFYRLRSFSINKGRLVKLGDSIASRRSRSPGSPNTATSRLAFCCLRNLTKTFLYCIFLLLWNLKNKISLKFEIFVFKFLNLLFLFLHCFYFIPIIIIYFKRQDKCILEKT